MPATGPQSRRPVTLSENDYLMLAAFRHKLREFQYFSEKAATAAGLHPKQHQAMLAIRGVPPGESLTVGELASKLMIRHHSAVGLVARMQADGLVTKRIDALDRRRVRLMLTSRSKRTLGKLTAAHKAELARVGPALKQILTQLGLVS